MSTTVTEAPAAEPTVTPPATFGFDNWVCFPATWEIYTELLDARGERSRPRYIFLDGRITAVSPGRSHEWIKMRISHLIYDIAMSLSIGFHATGQVTLRKLAKSREGTEADTSYYLTNIDRVRDKRHLVMGQEPPPDLVVEVVISHPERDALEAYRRFGVREVWVCRPPELEFLVLGADGEYSASPTSACFPGLTSEELAPWAYRDDLASDTDVLKLFRAWVEETLVPRHRPAADA